MLESEHILVLGWSNKLLRMLVELCSANAQRVSPLKPCSAQLSPMQRSVAVGLPGLSHTLPCVCRVRCLTPACCCLRGTSACHPCSTYGMA